MQQRWPRLGVLALCLLSAVLLLYWGGQDKQGRFHAEYLWANGNLGLSLFCIGPYLLLGTAALLTQRQKAAATGLTATAVVCGIRVLVGWIEHEQYLREPPGRETLPLLGFLATILLWLWSVAALATTGIARLRARNRTAA